jgi:hypothetical protein
MFKPFSQVHLITLIHQPIWSFFDTRHFIRALLGPVSCTASEIDFFVLAFLSCIVLIKIVFFDGGLHTGQSTV